MPRLDHCHSPLSPRRHWESFPVKRAGAIAVDLNEAPRPEGCSIVVHTQLGPFIEIDAATSPEDDSIDQRSGGTATLSPLAWAPPAPVGADRAGAVPRRV